MTVAQDEAGCKAGRSNLPYNLPCQPNPYLARRLQPAPHPPRYNGPNSVGIGGTILTGGPRLATCSPNVRCRKKPKVTFHAPPQGEWEPDVGTVMR
mmetsp:Transcript_143630/g.250696  ORF Transcript_143630/g.250696 Transcript_143630/m.250696 type:complete len:96 (+) Transcript_143630:81-368(+)